MVQGFSIKYGTRKKKAQQSELVALERKLQIVEKESTKDIQLFRDTQRQIMLIKKSIHKLRMQKTKGAMLRSTADWLEYGEKSSKMFYALERHRTRNKTIQKLINQSNNKEIDTTDDILVALHSFYSDLFDEHPIDENSDFLQGLHIPQVTAEDKKILDSPIQLEEIDIAVKQLACDKCPGPDGYTMNFIQKFYPLIKHMLHSVYLKAIKENRFPESLTTGTIALMEKLSKNPLFLKHWRPLSMLNSDYKIFAKIIANRLQLVLPYLIHKNQVGFMKGRRISDNLSELLTVIDYCQKTQMV